MSNELKPEPVKKRPRYFDGQYLKVDDFVDEQAYHIDRQRRISQFLHVSGILEGLQVTIENNLLQITPGAAIDNAGRQILFTGEATYRTQILKSSQNPFEIDLSLSKLDSTTHNLSIAWAEVGSDEQSDGGSQEKTRIYELPEIVIRPASESLSSSVLLAVLKGKGAGNSFELDLTSRQYSGLKLPTTNGQGITLRSQNGASDRAILSSSLSVTQNLQVDGNVGIGGASGTERLKVGGNTAIAGSLSITGTSNNLTVDGNVGIGTSSIQNPKLYNRLLDILGSNNAALSVRSTGGITTSMVSHDSFGGRASIGTDTKHKFELRTNDIPRMTIATDGKVGIGGDPDATEKLKVTGNAIIAGNLSVTGTSTLSGNTTIAGPLSVTGTNGNLTVAGTSTLSDKVGIGGAPATGTEKLKVTGDAAIAGTLSVTGTSTLSGNTTIIGTLSVTGTDPVVLTVNGRLKSNDNNGGLFISSDRFIGGLGSNLVGFYNGSAWRLTVDPSGNTAITGNLSVMEKLIPSNGNNPTNGIVFLPNPGGGSGDSAWIQYYVRESESCTLRLGIGNDREDHISLMPSGNVGIGTDTPTKAKLEILGSALHNLTGGYGYLGRIHQSTADNPGAQPYSIYTDQRIACVEFNAHSDIRIKQVKGRSNSHVDLSILRQIEITDYTLKDTISNLSGDHKKVLGQQIAQVFPQAVSTVVDIVPDIFQSASLSAGWIKLNSHNLKVGEKVRIFAEGIEPQLCRVESTSSDGFQVSLSYEGTVFVYGREVDDFHVVDYDALAMLHVSATQELCKIIDDLKLRVQQLEAQFTSGYHNEATITATSSTT